MFNIYEKILRDDVPSELGGVGGGDGLKPFTGETKPSPSNNTETDLSSSETTTYTSTTTDDDEVEEYNHYVEIFCEKDEDYQVLQDKVNYFLNRSYVYHPEIKISQTYIENENQLYLTITVMYDMYITEDEEDDDGRHIVIFCEKDEDYPTLRDKLNYFLNLSGVNNPEILQDQSYIENENQMYLAVVLVYDGNSPENILSGNGSSSSRYKDNTTDKNNPATGNWTTYSATYDSEDGSTIEMTDNTALLNIQPNYNTVSMYVLYKGVTGSKNDYTIIDLEKEAKNGVYLFNEYKYVKEGNSIRKNDTDKCTYNTYKISDETKSPDLEFLIDDNYKEYSPIVCYNESFSFKDGIPDYDEFKIPFNGFFYIPRYSSDKENGNIMDVLYSYNLKESEGASPDLLLKYDMNYYENKEIGDYPYPYGTSKISNFILFYLMKDGFFINKNTKTNIFNLNDFINKQKIYLKIKRNDKHDRNIIIHSTHPVYYNMGITYKLSDIFYINNKIVISYYVNGNLLKSISINPMEIFNIDTNIILSKRSELIIIIEKIPYLYNGTVKNNNIYIDNNNTEDKNKLYLSFYDSNIMSEDTILYHNLNISYPLNNIFYVNPEYFNTNLIYNMHWIDTNTILNYKIESDSKNYLYNSIVYRAKRTNSLNNFKWEKNTILYQISGGEPPIITAMEQLID